MSTALEFERLKQENAALRELLRDLTKSIEFYHAKQRSFTPVDEYDEMMFPIWARVDALKVPGAH